MAVHPKRRTLLQSLVAGLSTALVLGSCGLESTLSLCPLDEDSNEVDGVFIQFTHELCGGGNPPVAQIDAFRGYDIYYRIYGDSANQDSRREADIEAIEDRQRQAVTTLNARNYQRVEVFEGPDRGLPPPTIDLSGSEALRRGPVEVSIDFSDLDEDSELDGDNDATASWSTPSGDVSRVLGRYNESDNRAFTTDRSDYSADDADVDNQLSDDDLAYEIVLFAVSYGRDPDEFGAISSFEARLLTSPNGLVIATD